MGKKFKIETLKNKWIHGYFKKLIEFDSNIAPIEPIFIKSQINKNWTKNKKIQNIFCITKFL